jgi:hypothetical protein
VPLISNARNLLLKYLGTTLITFDFSFSSLYAQGWVNANYNELLFFLYTTYFFYILTACDLFTVTRLIFSKKSPERNICNIVKVINRLRGFLWVQVIIVRQWRCPFSPSSLFLGPSSLEEHKNVLNVNHCDIYSVLTRAPRQTLGPARGRHVLLQRAKRQY